jgi:pimeloyl-ACP methyl ester carboxylesterase
MKNFTEENIFFKNNNKNLLAGVLRLVDNDKLSPILLICHGFAAHKNAPGNIQLVDFLTSNDFNTFRFDLSGHGESEGLFENLMVSQGAEDILSALFFLHEHNFKNIILIGTSYGGACSIIAASKSEYVKKLILRSPVADVFTRELLIRSKEDMQKWKKDGVRKFMNFNNTQTLELKYSYIEDAKRINGFELAENIQIPTHIVHGDKDESVPIILSEILIKCIPNSTLTVIKDADHRYTDAKLNEKALKTILEAVE